VKELKRKIEALLQGDPGLRAREIASRLGAVRRDVNVVLHGDGQRFEKDSSHGWRVVGSRLGISLPSGWINAEDFEQALSLGGNALGGPEREVTLYLPHGCSPMIDCTARLLSLSNQLADVGKDVLIDFSASPDAHSYLDRAGFFDQLDSRVTVLPNRPELSAALRYAGRSGTMVEFGSVDPASDNTPLINELTKKFVQQSSMDYEVAALTIFGELIGNVAEHSKSPIAGFSGLQKYKGRRSHIQTVVSDSGLGIAATLRPALKDHYPALHRKYGERGVESDIGLVTEALLRGKVSRSGKGHGLGFYSSKEQAFKYRAKFAVRQETFCVTFEYREGQIVRTAYYTDVEPLLGTHICFDFYVD